MAVDWFRQRASRTWEVDDGPTIKASAEYLCRVTDKDDGPTVVKAHDTCPAIGDAYDDDNAALLCRSVKVELEEVDGQGGAIYSVEATYSTQSDNANGGDSGSGEIDPTQRPLELRMGFERTDYPWYKAQANPTAEDEDGAAIAINTAAGYNRRGKTVVASTGEKFDPNPTTTKSDPVYTLTKSVSTADFVTLSNLLEIYVDTVNSTAFSVPYRGTVKTFAAGTVFLADASSEPGYEGGVQFERVTLTLRVRRDGWLRKLHDIGHPYKESDFNPSKPPPMGRDSDGEISYEPVPLNGKGNALPIGDKNVFLKFQEWETKNFNTLISALE